ncbi:ribbon-helix-helix domain-containing protein [Nesterenkonia ebinurensis]|uniref:ribbon-helix-helix domain-containing protein n=1 Tax=Nesterenkonia ebinurensis TaxID=2608252 RepID=UPI00123D6E36|nr:type II toxin-antitoxin system ParD family antitoxin [Nesterenkonia ebinurensis]
MVTISVSVPDELKEYIDQRVARGDYASAEEYLAEKAREDRDRYEVQHQALRQKILDGMNSGPGVPWSAVRTEAQSST